MDVAGFLHKAYVDMIDVPCRMAQQTLFAKRPVGFLMNPAFAAQPWQHFADLIDVHLIEKDRLDRNKRALATLGIGDVVRRRTVDESGEQIGEPFGVELVRRAW